MRNSVKTLRNENGFVLVTGLLILVILTLIGLAATRNTSVELQIAGNDRITKETFYVAEADDILSTEILEQSFACPTGFTKDGTTAGGVNFAEIEGTIRIFERRMDRTNTSTAGSAMNRLSLHRNAPLEADSFDITNPGFYIGNESEADGLLPYPIFDSGGTEFTYLYIAGEIRMLPGAALQMAAGYEGKGKGAGGGGVGKIMDMYSAARGAVDSKAYVAQGWRHLVGTESTVCKY